MSELKTLYPYVLLIKMIYLTAIPNIRLFFLISFDYLWKQQYWSNYSSPIQLLP